jgi:hypothetical protein
LKIVIVGQPKTGTSALFFKIKNSFHGRSLCLFEPRPEQIVSPVNAFSDDTMVLAKVLLLNDGQRHEYISGFDRQIFITRDPRDRLISALLYSVRDSSYFNDDSKVSRLLSALELKEKQPASISVATLWKLCIELDNRTSFDAWVSNLPRSLDFVFRFCEAYPQMYRLKYEDFIDERLEPLQDYLQMPLAGEARVSGEYARVERTRSYGNWRDWFTPSDVELFRSAYRTYMSVFSYDDDWSLNDTPTILPQHASGYVRRIVEQRRQERD